MHIPVFLRHFVLYNSITVTITIVSVEHTPHYRQFCILVQVDHVEGLMSDFDKLLLLGSGSEGGSPGGGRERDIVNLIEVDCLAVALDQESVAIVEELQVSCHAEIILGVRITLLHIQSFRESEGAGRSSQQRREGQSDFLHFSIAFIE